MVQAKFGDTVRVHYTGRLQENGTGFDSSENGDPLEFTIGSGRIISGFEQAVIGMFPGERKTIKIPSLHAYGPRQNELIFNVNPSRLPEGLEPQVGLALSVVNGNHTTPVVIVAVAPGSVTLDANHPLAGKDLEFDIRLLEIKAAA